MVSRKQTTYGYQTIGSLIQLLKNAVQETPYLNLNSPVMISDYNMSEIKYEFDVLPSFSQAHHTAGLCLFHSLGAENKGKEIYIEPSYDTEDDEPFFRDEEDIEEDTSVVKFAKWFMK